MNTWEPPPFRVAFDNARDPYTARNALGIMGTGGGFITSVSSPLSVTGGNLTIDLSGYQPVDGDLTAISALTGTNTIYYRSGTNVWSPVTIGTGLTFSGGTLAGSAAGAPADAEYITSSTNASLSAERVLTNTTSITWDFATAGQAKANHAAQTGDVTTTAGGVATTIATDVVDNTKLANMAQATIKGRASGAGTGDPTDLTATQVGTIIAPGWTLYTPTLTAVSGSLTSAVAAGASYTVGKLTFVRIGISITTNGTAAGGVIATLPNTSAAMTVLSGRENSVSGNMLQAVSNHGLGSSTSLVIFNYNNTYPGANGANLIVGGCYEST